MASQARYGVAAVRAAERVATAVAVSHAASIGRQYSAAR
jgi:hypothetical protein